MKNTLRYIIITLILLGLSAGSAHADDEGIAALGGFLAGVITGVIIEDQDHDRYHRSGVHISVGDRHDRYGRHDRYSRHDRRGPSGHWEMRRTKVWVPGHWEFKRNRCGDRVKVWIAGHHRYERRKVWVTYRSKKHRGSYCG